MQKKISTLLAALLAATLVARVNESPAQEKKLATFKGKVTFSGSKPEKNQNDTSPKDEESCGKSRPTEKLLVDEATKGVQDVVIYVKDKLQGEFDPKYKKVVLDQKSCVFKNHVTLVAEGGEVVFKNSDTVLHNVKFNSTNNGTYNQGLGAGKEQSQTFKAAEFVTIECSVHPWMTAVVVVMAHPYYTLTNSKGEFELPVPPGKHRIMVQHQVLGKLDKKGEEIEIKEGETSRSFEFK